MAVSIKLPQMQTKFGGKLHPSYGPLVSDLKDVGKRSLERDLNDWRWHGDLFMAAPLNTVPSDCRSRQLFPVGSNIPVNNGASNSFQLGSGEVMLGNERESRDSDKRRRVFEVEHEHANEEVGSLNLKLGGQVYSTTEGELDDWKGRVGRRPK